VEKSLNVLKDLENELICSIFMKDVKGHTKKEIENQSSKNNSEMAGKLIPVSINH
jgi:hypothetical protein